MELWRVHLLPLRDEEDDDITGQEVGNHLKHFLRNTRRNR